MALHILIIEDDKKLNDGIRLALKNESYLFHQCQTLSEARKVLANTQISLILLDINLPDGNGIDFVKEIRLHIHTPIILITVNNDELDIVTGLEAGANDYITKPFGLMELRARASVQLRPKGTTEEHFSTDIFDFNFASMEFFKDGQPVELSKTEQKLLKVLCSNRGATVKRSHLIDTVWQGDEEFVDEHTLTVAIKRLRNKLETDPKNPAYIKTVYGIGYTWALK